MSIIAKLAIAFTAGLLAGLLMFFVCGKSSAPKAQPLSLIARDTVLRIMNREPLQIERLKAKIRYVRDTVIRTQPFSATADTVVLHDTVRVRFDFPQNTFSLRLTKPPDTLLTERLVFAGADKKAAWWEKPLLFAAGVVSGIIIKSIK